MGWESGSRIGGKRARAAEDEVYFDNYHTHKRYLTEVMASSLNGLKVGEAPSHSGQESPPLLDTLLSPAHTETPALSRSASSFPSHGDDNSTLDSPMSDDSDESVGYRMGRASELPHYKPCTEPVLAGSPISSARNRYSYAASGYSSGMSSGQQTPPPYTPSLPLPCSQPRVKVPDTEGRLPPSPNDPCQSADLRKTALMRSLQMRAQSPGRTASSAVTPIKNMEKVLIGDGLGEVGDQSSPGLLAYSPEQTGCNSEDLRSSSNISFPPLGSRAANCVRSLLLDECMVPATVAMSTTSPFLGEEQEVEKVARLSRFEENNQRKIVKGYSKLANATAREGITSDTESSLWRRPRSPFGEKSCKRGKPC